MGHRAQLRAFTLVELLVVITIISLLLTLLLPSLASAREMARRVVCLNNQKQIFIAAASYINDNKEYMPPGSNPYYGYVEVQGAVNAAYWGDFGSFWRDYLQVPLDPRPTRMYFSSPKGPLWCPSGTRLSYTSKIVTANPTVGDTNVYTNLGWQESIDYALMGCAPVVNQYPYWPARSTQWWQSFIPYGPRLFSMDIESSITGTIEAARTPHLGSNDLPLGMNCVSVDGSGGWQGLDRVTFQGGNRPGGVWQYYVNWASVVMPIKYEVLYTEWNYTYNWPPGGVFTARNGVYTNASYTLDEVGLRRWP